MKYRTEKAKEIGIEIDRLYDKMDAEKRRCREIFVKYEAMEGKYGEKVYADFDCGQGMRGYHYEYKTEELARKEHLEREQFLKDNNYKREFDIEAEYEDKLRKLREAFSLEQYGMTVEKKNKLDEVKSFERRVKRAKEELKDLMAKLEKAKTELENIK